MTHETIITGDHERGEILRDIAAGILGCMYANSAIVKATGGSLTLPAGLEALAIDAAQRLIAEWESRT